MNGAGGEGRRAAVLGSPVAHSRSPQLHLAAYRALGLTGWSYDRIECNAAELPALVGGFGPEWVGVSVTMPGKFAALRFADERTERARLLGSANTLVRTATGWRADNTDVDGVSGALAAVVAGDAGGRAVVLGAGGTAPAAIAGLAQLGYTDITVVARTPAKAQPLVGLGGRLGVAVRATDFDGASAAGATVVVSTIPAAAAAAHARAFAGAPVLLDAIYEPWPTPLAEAVSAAGGTVVSGLQMLLNQAYAQVEQFTGLPAPKSAMSAALGDR
ncbi:shikimate dehydrogenase [Mycobacterium sp. MYCO198283]|uniref:shikimate dehydrogenase n=1 Tax=Mycobacterium sp. MYCO198283 TaxID=2883505 RepID=UPI001E29CC0C|nr:shikimate dehydrogenase [Mycobacterium sp. MYCO198283]MCG5433636.1 shikimate dehydrogenase [Mycobacterium sp. MYCO198283]